MTDEAKPMLEDVFAPWRAWPEWDIIADLPALKDDLCERVWREAQMHTAVIAGRHLIDAGKRQHSLKTALDECARFEDEVRAEMLTERTRADAAEAQRDRLAAALAAYVAFHDDGKGRYDAIDLDVDGRIAARRLHANARAALADMREEGDDVKAPPARFAAEEHDVAARRRDETYTALRRDATAFMELIECTGNDADRPAGYVAALTKLQRALALARQAEEA